MTAAPDSHDGPGTLAATPWRQVRAAYDAESVTVYQAYSPAIADAALAVGQFVPPFRRERMTWVKPSFLWMMYRSGWATKKGQERVLAVRLSREGLQEALARSCLSAFAPRFHPDWQAWEALRDTSPVRIQWDPERDLALTPLGHRCIQIGIGPPAVDDYVERWTLSITDVTPAVTRLRTAPTVTPSDLPVERPYPLPPDIAARVGIQPPCPYTPLACQICTGASTTEGTRRQPPDRSPDADGPGTSRGGHPSGHQRPGPGERQR